MSQFERTYEMLKVYIGDRDYRTYWDWMVLPERMKAPALYVKFFDSILIAWIKLHEDFMSEEDNVSEVLQYLMKNVDKIKGNRQKYNGAYIYRIAFNCICARRRIQRDIDWYFNRRSDIDMIQTSEHMYSDDPDGEAFTIDRMFVVDNEIEEIEYESSFWEVVNTCTKEEKRLLEYFLGGKPVGKKITARQEVIIAELRVKFSRFRK